MSESYTSDKAPEPVDVSMVSKSQSAKMILGFFPPNSNDSFLNCGAAVRLMVSPVFVPPVNDIALISRCEVIADPVFCPEPCTMFNTPFGGMKSSGVGREGGDEALRFFTEPKNICTREV